MVRKFFLIVLVGISVTVSMVNGQTCIPKSVTNLSLLPNGTLSWSVSALESCEVTHFHINIHRDGATDYDVEVSETFVDVTFIPFCLTWVFTVRAITANSSSLGHILIAKIPLSSDAALELSILEVVEEDDDLHLTWELADDLFRYCADSYRVTVSDEQNGDYSDIYVTQNSFNLDFISPCVTYEFGVRVINNGRPAEGPLKSIEYDAAPAIQNPPRLTAVNLGSTTANTTWVLDSFIENRCPIRNLYVDGGQYFNISIPVKDSTEREPVEVNLSSLRSNSMYVLRVSVENSGGVSGQSIVGVQTLDLGPGVL